MSCLLLSQVHPSAQSVFQSGFTSSTGIKQTLLELINSCLGLTARGFKRTFSSGFPPVLQPAPAGRKLHQGSASPFVASPRVLLTMRSRCRKSLIPTDGRISPHKIWGKNGLSYQTPLTGQAGRQYRARVSHTTHFS